MCNFTRTVLNKFSARTALHSRNLIDFSESNNKFYLLALIKQIIQNNPYAFTKTIVDRVYRVNEKYFVSGRRKYFRHTTIYNDAINSHTITTCFQ